MAPKEGKIISFDAFKQKGKIEEPEKPAEAIQEANTESETAEKVAEGHGAKPDCKCLVCTFRREEQIDLIQVLERARELNSRIAQGRFNPSDLRDWRTNLQKESVQELVRRVHGLDESKVQTHPTYSKAVFEIFWAKLRQLRAAQKVEDEE